MKKYLVAFLLPIIIFILNIYILDGGINGNNLLISDMGAQYISLFSYLKEILSGDASIFYSFNNGIGGEMFSAFLYYLASPLNLIIIFFSKSNITTFILVILCLKLGLASCSMYYYLEKNNSNSKTNILFSLCYALCGYVVSYYFNIMWLDALCFLPLLCITLDKIMQNKKSPAYIILLVLTIFSNYYIGYMICIFLVLYIIYQLYIKNPVYKKAIIKKFIIIAGGICACFLIPNIINIQKFTKLELSLNINIVEIKESILHIWSNLFIGAHNCKNILNTNSAFLYTTMFVLILVYLYFRNKKISKREKLGSAILITIFLLSFILKPLIYAWHGFSFPNFFNNRNAFLLSFVLILLACRSFKNLQKFKLKDIIIYLSIWIVGSICIYYQHYSWLTIYNIGLTFLFIIIYFLLLYNYTHTKQNIWKIILVIFVVIEIFITTNQTLLAKTKVTETYENITTKMCGTIEPLNGRIYNEYIYSGLDGLLCDYSSLTTFLSTITEKDIQFFNRVGFNGGGRVYYSSGQNTKFIESVLGVNNKITSEKSNQKIFSLNVMDEEENIKSVDYYLHKNNSALSLGFVIENNLILADNVFENQNNIASAFSGITEDFLINIPITKTNENQYKIYVEDDRLVYFKINYLNNQDEELTIVLDGKLERISNMDKKGIINLELLKGEHTITFDSEIDNIKAAYVNEEIEKKHLEKMSEYQLQDIKIVHNYLKGSIQLDEESLVLLTIPNQKGIEVYVDGKIVKTNSILDYFIGIELEKGIHQIEVKYDLPRRKTGLFITLISVCFSLIYMKNVKNSKKIKKNQ